MTLLSSDFVKAPGAEGQPLAPLPPLTIGAFTCTSEVAAMLTRLQDSRHMVRVTLTVQPGGIGAAIVSCAEAGAPQLLVIESEDDEQALLARLDALAELCDPDTRVVVIGGTNDVTLYRALLRQGVSDYLPRPVRPEQVLRSLSDITSQPGGVAKGAVTAFLGSSGGVGSSTVALNAAWMLGQGRQMAVNLVDLDLDFGTAGLSLALDGSHGIAEALATGTNLDGQLLDGLFDTYDPHLRVLAASDRTGLAVEPAADATDHLVDLARSGGHRVVLDLPGFGNAVTRRAVRTADQVVVTTTPDLAGIRNTRKLLDLIAALRPDEPKPLVVLNRHGMARRQEIGAKDFAQTLGIEFAALLAFDPKGYSHAANLGKVYAATPAGKSARAALQPLVARLTHHAPHEAPAPAARPFWSRLLHRT